MSQSKIVLISLLSSAFAVCVATTAAGADEHDAHHPAATAPAPTQSPPEVSANMKKMREQMAAIHAAKGSKERAKLMDEHMQTMQATMSGMEKSGGCMDGMMKGGEGGMGMMQMMMDQMMQHQKAMHDTPK